MCVVADQGSVGRGEMVYFGIDDCSLLHTGREACYRRAGKGKVRTLPAVLAGTSDVQGFSSLQRLFDCVPMNEVH